MKSEKTRVTPVICVSNDGYPASLEIGKLYSMLPDGEPGLHMVRVIDESGEDYLFPEDYFEPVESTGRGRDRLMKVLGLGALAATLFVAGSLKGKTHVQ